MTLDTFSDFLYESLEHVGNLLPFLWNCGSIGTGKTIFVDCLLSVQKDLYILCVII